jgi:hypothetical protein
MMTNIKTAPAWGNELARLWIQSGQAFPVNVRELALEVTKRRTEFSTDPIACIKPHGVAGIDGMLSKRKRGDWCISYDATVAIPGRINFTLGHELGHYLLHRKNRDNFQCGQQDMLDYNRASSKKMEVEANTFAAFLLIPANDFREQINGNIISIDLLRHCATRYGTSFTATALKWLEITNEAAMLIMARDEFICWSYPSELARKKGAYIRPGTPLPHSAKTRLSSAMHKLNQWCSVQPGVWHPTMEAEESVINSDQFEQSIFLVRFQVEGATHQEEDLVEDTSSFLDKRARGLCWKK